ncbi:SEC10/PgrA surface exclusion domain-containing protein [Apilactobacillus bombintestini]|uniref:SEC10/PgrA surface exclusion domain-containing protein n=1 Tax=Apilactobacillus bombintestini TaxID=2419772 RepID=A0A387AR85_9LACO|nr:SEC10/PgrA surface exclusion domain-containing protein [Apilactobacillus bombintestini]AYF92138.1 SEC10/PgrA surface exclusion domain-containing protein [Apilactobacillus bombintestini]
MKKSVTLISIAAAVAVFGIGLAVFDHQSNKKTTSKPTTVKVSKDALLKFKQQTTDDAIVATTKSISQLSKDDLNNFIPTEAMKVKGNQITDPGSDANFVTKINYQPSDNPKNVIRVPKEYTIKRLKTAASEKAIGNYKLQVQLGKIGLNGLAMNSFTPSKLDLSRNVDLNHMSYADRKELTKFGLDLINSVITQTGGIQYKASKNSIEAAQAYADVYSKDNWNNTHHKTGHNPNARKVVAKQFNISDVAEENYSDNPSFALTDPKLKKRVVSMAALKHAIYNSMALQLFEDGPSYWGHATALMNLDIHKQYQPNYFGVSFDKFGGIHFFMVPHNAKVNPKFVTGDLI